MMRSDRRQRAYDLTNGRCIYCGAALADDEDVVPAGTDTYVARPGYRFLCVTLRTPRRAGGRSNPVNEVPACHLCSSLKGTKPHEVFVAELARRERGVTEHDNVVHPVWGTWQHIFDSLPANIVRLLDNPPLPPGRRRSGDPRRPVPGPRG